MKKLIICIAIILQAKFIVSVGGYDLCEKNNIYKTYDGNCTINANITDYTKKEMPNINSVSIWVTKDFKFNKWFPAESVNKHLVKKGYVPLFIIYWWRDDISIKYIKKHKKEYFEFLHKCNKYFSKIHGKIYIVLNPEYNENGVETWNGWNNIMRESYRILKTKYRMIGYGLGDFGQYNITFDYGAFKSFSKSFQAVRYFDFIAFQEMRATTRDTKGAILNTPYRSLEFAKYLYKRYHKPTFLAYLALSSYKGEKLQTQVYKRYSELLPLFKKEAHLIGFNVFHLFDRPQQVGYFKEAEKYFGLIDKNGNKKPAYFWFLDIRP